MHLTVYRRERKPCRHHPSEGCAFASPVPCRILNEDGQSAETREKPLTRIGVLLINTGTPDEPTEEAARRFLAEMLSDPALVNVPRIIWKHVLNRAILPKRPAKMLPTYQRIWTPEGSRFMLISQSQRDMIATRLDDDNGADSYEVVLAMRYGNPSVISGLEKLRGAGCERIVAVPLYPQYVNVCAGTCLGEVRRCLDVLARGGWSPELIEIRQFFEQPAYLEGLAESIRTAWESASAGPTSATHRKLVFCWHSTLLADIERGDPYRDQNEQTARIVAEKLGLAANEWTIAYSSRFDNRKWLQPFIADVLLEAASQGYGDVAVVCPGFVADNIETLVEIDETMRGTYLEAAPAGARFTYVPALNDSYPLATAIARSVHEATCSI